VHQPLCRLHQLQRNLRRGVHRSLRDLPLLLEGDSPRSLKMTVRDCHCSQQKPSWTMAGSPSCLVANFCSAPVLVQEMGTNSFRLVQTDELNRRERPAYLLSVSWAPAQTVQFLLQGSVKYGCQQKMGKKLQHGRKVLSFNAGL